MGSKLLRSPPKRKASSTRTAQKSSTKTKQKPETSDQPTVPLILDDVKKLKDFQMTRFSYFSIECDEPSEDWAIILENSLIPFIMTSMSGIIFKPLGARELFESSDLLEDLFDTVESVPGLFVDTNDVWIPNSLVPGRSQVRGSVYRATMKLFRQALLYRNDQLTASQFLKSSPKLKGQLFLSKPETDAFRIWQKKQIDDAKDLYKERGGLTLKWTT